MSRFNRGAVAWLIVMTVCGALAPLIAHDPRQDDRLVGPLVPHSPTRTSPADRLEPPSAAHLMGTDDLGRDVLARLIHGSRTSLLVGLITGAASLLIGAGLGAIAGWYGGFIDTIISRSIESVLSFPNLFLVLAIIAIAGPSIWSIIAAFVVTGWVHEARFVRAEVLRLRESELSLAAVATGAAPARVIFRHLLPIALAPALVSASFGAAGAIAAEAALTFLGFGVQLPHHSWGAILATARNYAGVAWWLVIFPGTTIFLTILSIHAIGDDLADRLDPRERAFASSR